MPKLTLPFVNTKCPIPIVRFPLADGKSIYAIIDTGSECTLYDISVKDANPELFGKSKYIGKQRVVGVNETKEADVYASGMRLSVKQENEEDIAFKFVAYSHSFFGESIKGLIDMEGLTENVPLLMGSDSLNWFNAKIDMKKKAICITIPKVKKKKAAEAA